LAAEAHYFFLDEKATKNQVSRDAPLPHGALPCKSGKTTGYVLLPCCRSLNVLTSAKSLMPFSIAQSHQFYLLSPEAFLLTLCGKGKLLVSEKIKKEAWGSQGARPGVWPVYWQRSS
jgi:hypothetical protein